MDTLTNQPRRAETLYLGYEGRRMAHDLPVGAPAIIDGEIVHTRTRGDLFLRQIHPCDWPALRRGFAGLTAEEVRLRFLHPLTELPEAVARKLCDIDNEHAAAFVLIDGPGTAEPEIHAVARAFIDPVTLAAEFAIVVQHDLARQGLGTLLMQRLIAACRALGATEMWGDVLAENTPMLDLAKRLGFGRHGAYQDPGVVRVSLPL